MNRLAVDNTMPEAINFPCRRLRRSEASAYMLAQHGVSRTPATLAKLACIGGGPIYRLAGRIPLYEPADLDRWVDSIMSSPRRSTSDSGTR
jgi:hypothetical protein